MKGLHALCNMTAITRATHLHKCTSSRRALATLCTEHVEAHDLAIRLKQRPQVYLCHVLGDLSTTLA